MEITASILGLVTCLEVANFVLIAAEELSFNVSYPKGIEQDFLRLKRRKPSIKPPREEKLRLKEHVCTAIIGSDFFDAHNVELVNPDHRTIYKQVKHDHPKIHEEHFKRGHSLEYIKPKFANPYRLREVPVSGTRVREFMFSCLTRNCATKAIQQYFVSPKYMHWSMGPVRYVFNDKLVVIAVAEKKASKQHGGAEHARPTTEQARQHPAQPSEEASNEDSGSAYKDDDESESESW